jgi:cellulose synthase/poly-beta-1,6-N-acetylglucosamine synthase-like glycosyltransferase
VEKALASDYPELQVIVVNDGSLDRTGELLEQNFGGNPRVRIVHQTNMGKPAALNHALAEASGEIVVTIDADTDIEPDAIAKLVRNFTDPTVGAVAGNTKVGNRHLWLTRWQALEYISSQNMEKRAFDLLNCITVVPGAIGAWRAAVMRECGGFTGDTVAEDTDLTLAIRRRHWRILYDDEAVAYTLAPETPGELIRQRFRWTFGTMQAVWKHRDTLARAKYGTLGWIALPNVFLFQIVLPLFSPLIDLLFVGSLTLWGLGQMHIRQIPQIWSGDDVRRAVLFFLAFLVIDFFTCLIAFLLERDEDYTLLFPMLLQRFYYRQMMYVVLFRAVVRAVQGRHVGWGHPVVQGQ